MKKTNYIKLPVSLHKKLAIFGTFLFLSLIVMFSYVFSFLEGNIYIRVVLGVATNVGLLSMFLYLFYPETKSIYINDSQIIINKKKYYWKDIKITFVVSAKEGSRSLAVFYILYFDDHYLTIQEAESLKTRLKGKYVYLDIDKLRIIFRYCNEYIQIVQSPVGISNESLKGMKGEGIYSSPINYALTRGLIQEIEQHNYKVLNSKNESDKII